jgi:hypothetical protein
MTFQSQRALDKMNAICDVLRLESLTIAQLEKKMKCSNNSLRPYIAELRRKNRVHICGYFEYKSPHNLVKECTRKSAVYKTGYGDDAKRTHKRPKPAPKPEKVDVKIVMSKAVDFPFFKNTDPLMQAFYGL